DELLAARAEQDVAGDQLADRGDLAGAVLLSVVLDELVRPLVEAVGVRIGGDLEHALGDLVAARDDRGSVAEEVIGLRTRAVGHGVSPAADDRMILRDRMRLERLRGCRRGEEDEGARERNGQDAPQGRHFTVTSFMNARRSAEPDSRAGWIRWTSIQQPST